jgi:hypothetical protein
MENDALAVGMVSTGGLLADTRMDDANLLVFAKSTPTAETLRRLIAETEMKSREVLADKVKVFLLKCNLKTSSTYFGKALAWWSKLEQ